jgi:hypothetical protein
MDVENAVADVNIIPSSGANIGSSIAGNEESAAQIPQKVKTSFVLAGAARKKICTQKARAGGGFSFRSISGTEMDVSDDDDGGV